MIDIQISAPMVQVRFTVTDGETTLTDALSLSIEDHAAMTDEQIQLTAEMRFDNWKQFVTAQSKIETPMPTLEDLQTQLDQVNEDRSQLDIVAADLAQKLDVSVPGIALKA